MLAILVSFVGVLVVTCDFILFGIVLSVCFGLTGLTFFISVICGWGFAPVEAIGLIFFLGYAETYALHVTYRYASSTLLRETVARIPTAGAIRLHRARSSMKSIGKASLGSAITTVLSAFFLLFCTLTMFQKLGGIVIACAFLSALFVILPLPAALMWFGPMAPGYLCREWCGCVSIIDRRPDTPRRADSGVGEESDADRAAIEAIVENEGKANRSVESGAEPRGGSPADDQAA